MTSIGGGNYKEDKDFIICDEVFYCKNKKYKVNAKWSKIKCKLNQSIHQHLHKSTHFHNHIRMIIAYG